MEKMIFEGIDDSLDDTSSVEDFLGTVPSKENDDFDMFFFFTFQIFHFRNRRSDHALCCFVRSRGKQHLNHR